jgi:uncharacterized protein (DUF2236 family)
VLNGRSTTPLRLPSPIQSHFDHFARSLLQPDNSVPVDFTQPSGEEALAAPDSVSWRIFKNPVALFVGGVAAVILEMAEPRVRSAVWEQSRFRTDPLGRLQRTGLAAMMTVYGPRTEAEKMIARVVRMHGRIAGTTPAGKTYRASDPELLTWVHATAAFGFSQAYDRYVRPLPPGDRDRLCAEAAPAALLYGVTDIPRTLPHLMEQIESLRAGLEPSPIVHEFLRIVGEIPILPMPLRPVQRTLVRAAVEIVPAWLRYRLGLLEDSGLRSWEMPLAKRIGRMSDRLLLPSFPAVQSCIRLGLPRDYLYH